MTETTLWQSVLVQIEKRVRRQQFETWFRCVQPLEAEGRCLRLAVPNRFYKDWLENYYIKVIRESISAVTGDTPEVSIEVSAAPPAEAAPLPDGEVPRMDDAPVYGMDGGSAASARGYAQAAPRDEPAAAFPFSPDYTFENFVVGPSNRLCHAASLAVVDAPGRAYNPLFLHGGVGLGKTHLMQAASRAYLSRNPRAKLVYTSCEEFVNDFVSAVQKGDIASFRSRLRDVDFLVIDDIHFLARAERTQEEFFHTFNSLYNAHKQIIVSSDSAPSEIPDLEERLVSRFKWGLVARLDPPHYETRLAIVRTKSQLRGCDVPADVAELVARSIETNIRELEGALTRVIGYASLTNRPISIEVAREALRDIVSVRKPVSIEDIARAVAARFNLKLSDLQGKRRSKSIALPRQICMHVARHMTEYSLQEIGGFFGGRDHTTVMYADDKVDKLVGVDPKVRDTVNSVKAELLKPAR
jgi:chromosomal replication initiator protein